MLASSEHHCGSHTAYHALTHWQALARRCLLGVLPLEEPPGSPGGATDEDLNPEWREERAGIDARSANEGDHVGRDADGIRALRAGACGAGDQLDTAAGWS